MADDPRIHHGACNLCEAICGLRYEVRGSEILSIRGDEQDPFSRGHICPKAVALRDLYEDPDRLRQPLRRTAEGWEPVAWETAFDEISARLLAIRAAHGDDAIAAYLGNPNVHNYGSLTHAQHFLGHFRTRNRYSATSVDQLPHQLIVYWMYGHQLLVPVPDVDRSAFLVIQGGNPLASNGSLWTVPDVRQRLRELQDRGGRLVVIDPRKSETAEIADEHHAVRPGGDAALLLVVLHTILEEKLARPGRLADFSEGLDALPGLLAGLDLPRLARHAGLALPAIQDLARRFAAAPRAAWYGRMGVSTQTQGSLCQWLIQLLNLLTGNLDREGGMMFARPAVDLIDSPVSKPGSFGRWKSRVRGLPEFGGELPVAALAEEILTPGQGQVRALITSAGNPVLSTPDGAGLAAALDQLELMVSVDFYLNETTRHAHYILPPTQALEHDHYDLIFHHFAVRNSARYSEPLFAPAEGARHDWQIFTALGERIARGLGTAPKPPLRPDQILDLGLKSGPYGSLRGHPLQLDLARLRALPHGLDLGAHEPCLPQRLRHADRRIQACPPPLRETLVQYLQTLPAEPPAELLLIGRRHLRSNNSWMHNSQRLVKGPARHQLWMHPDDLQAHRLDSGSRVRLSSRRGSVEVEVVAHEGLRPGVVSLPHGWGHDRPGTRLGVAQGHAGVSANDLTDPDWLDALSGNAALNGVPVRIEAVGA
ncbi:MAG TPA: molybdopterin-dependent oxidoreductase [Nevskiaceae bacterium]|nr:molybdopterin-dependent oxidoreductase [Nevskiaceae bacterium]